MHNLLHFRLIYYNLLQLRLIHYSLSLIRLMHDNLLQICTYSNLVHIRLMYDSKLCHAFPQEMTYLKLTNA